MSRIVNNKVAYGKTQGLIDVFNPPIVSEGARFPTGNDKGSIGQLWTNATTNQVWMLTSYAAGLAVWTELDNNGGGGGIQTWITSGAGAVNLANNTGYYLTNVAVINLTLPIVSAVGAEIKIITQNSSAAGAGINLLQNALQTISYDNEVSAVGIGGSVSWINIGVQQLTVDLICTVANTNWSIVSLSRAYTALV